MKRVPTIFLRGAIFFIGIAVLAICVFGLPGFVSEVAKLAPQLASMQYPILLGLYATAIPFFYALYQSLKLLGYIDQNLVFSEVSVRALRSIRNCAIAISGIYVIGLPVFAMIGEADDAPGVVVLGLLIVLAPLVIATFAAVLQRLLQAAIEIKSENDLTV